MFESVESANVNLSAAFEHDTKKKSNLYTVCGYDEASSAQGCEAVPIRAVYQYGMGWDGMRCGREPSLVCEWRCDLSSSNGSLLVLCAMA